MTRTTAIILSAFLLTIGALDAQQPNGAAPAATNGAAPAAPAGVEPKRTDSLNDLEDLAKTKSALFQTRLQAIMADVLKSPEIAALQKEANELGQRANAALVKACGVSPTTHDYDFQKRVCVEKPKAPEKK